MRKIILFFIPIALLAAGCNSSADKVAQLEKQNQQLQQQVNGFDLQQKCSTAAEKFYNKYMEGTLTKTIRDGYVSHWNKVLGKCFVEISSGFSSDPNSINYEIDDALEGKNYGYVMFDSRKSFDGSTGVLCELFPNGNSESQDKNEFKSCKSKSEFDDYVKPFMNN